MYHVCMRLDEMTRLVLVLGFLGAGLWLLIWAPRSHQPSLKRGQTFARTFDVVVGPEFAAQMNQRYLRRQRVTR